MTLTLPEHLDTGAFIDGEFRPAISGATFDSLAPATGQPVATVAACDDGDVDAAVRSGRAAFDRGGWSRAAPAERKAVLLRLAALIDEQAGELAAIESIDAGKPITDC